MTNKEEFQLSIVINVLAWLDENITQGLTIHSIAEYSGYSHWHLQRIFKKYTGVTLGSYISKRQLYFAALDLLGQEKDIVLVAMKYGYESQQTFTRAFKSRLQVNPGRVKRFTPTQAEDFTQQTLKKMFALNAPVKRFNNIQDIVLAA
ncbi:helix-turn-helix domain-containing protein [Ewingella americana]|uniref:helix-turn-helix domain-containing protein n=1 Tax=Ewingella americana TaxID=41202 RepID=UPI00163A82EC|nr:helix-turn-helix domain-containing protein [Ewingella americana]QMV50802.1 helix-turn-helix domain-containing protein [Ewingella americana]